MKSYISQPLSVRGVDAARHLARDKPLPVSPSTTVHFRPGIIDTYIMIAIRNVFIPLPTRVYTTR